jgi:predicted nuclease of restriction endonuclease-like (RecB) superfamily
MLRIKLKKNQRKKKRKKQPKNVNNKFEKHFSTKKSWSGNFIQNKDSFFNRFFTSKNLRNLNKFIYGFKY